MATLDSRTISLSGTPDYSTLQSWNDDAATVYPSGLVDADVIWQGVIQEATDNFSTAGNSLFISGSTVDSTRYKELTVANGASFIDNIGSGALRYNESNGASAHSDTGACVDIRENYARISRLQIEAASSQGINVSNSNVHIDQCISESNGGTIGNTVYGSTTKVTNSLFVLRTSGSTTSIVQLSDSASLYNCTLARPSNLSSTTYGVSFLAGANGTVQNAAVFGATDAAQSGSSITFTTNYTDDSSPPTGFTATAYSTSSGAYFENISNGTHDYRIKSGSSLINNGTTDATNASEDILDTSRPVGSGYDVGAYENLNIILSIESLDQSQSVENNVLVQKNTLSNLSAINQNQNINNTILTQSSSIDINSVSQLQSIESSLLSHTNILEIQGTTQNQYTSNLVITASTANIVAASDNGIGSSSTYDTSLNLSSIEVNVDGNIRDLYTWGSILSDTELSDAVSPANLSAASSNEGIGDLKLYDTSLNLSSIEVNVDGNIRDLYTWDISLSDSELVEAVEDTASTTLVVNNISQTQNSSALILVHENSLVVDNIAEAQSIESCNVSDASFLGVSNVTQLQSTGQVELLQDSLLTIQDSAQGQIIEESSLAIPVTLTIDSISQQQNIDNVSIIDQGDALTISNSTQQYFSDSLIIFQQGVANLLSNVRILSINLADSANSVSASNTSGSLAASNMLTENKTEVHRSTGTSVTYTIQWNTNQVINTVSLPCTNLSSSATLDIRYYDSVSSILYDTGSILAVPGYSLDLGSRTHNVNEFSFGLISKSVSYSNDFTNVREVQIEVNDPSNSAGYIDCSRIVIGKYWEPTHNIQNGVKLLPEDDSKVSRTSAGELVAELGFIHDRMSFSFALLEESDKTELLKIIRNVGVNKNFLVNLFPGDSLEQDYIIYGKRSNDAITHRLYKFFDNSTELTSW